MRYLISYFYQIRFFTKNMIPLSTAKWDPRWYHANKGDANIFYDKNGVINGLRADVFAPRAEGSCGPDCPRNLENCAFKINYRKQLEEIDFNYFKRRCELTAEKYLPEEIDPVIVLIVHEAPDNKCSEREAIIEWFHKNGEELKEFTKNKT